MNASGHIVGYGSVGSATFPGRGFDCCYAPFLRAPDGTFTMLMEPVVPADINANGMIAGSRQASNSQAISGFLRDNSGNITYFDAPGTPSDLDGLGGTYSVALNDEGAVTGYFVATDVTHGFVRTAHGTFSNFDAVKGATWTIPTAINQSGVITGYYSTEVPSQFQTTPSQFHGFIRNAQGLITTFGVTGALSGTTTPDDINNSGQIVGSYGDSNGSHGFLRTPQGQSIHIDYPGLPPNGTCFACEGTTVTSINDAGVAVGYYGNTSGTHGFSVDTSRLWGG